MTNNNLLAKIQDSNKEEPNNQFVLDIDQQKDGYSN